jgi:hypothetical protein
VVNRLLDSSWRQEDRDLKQSWMKVLSFSPKNFTKLLASSHSLTIRHEKSRSGYSTTAAQSKDRHQSQGPNVQTGTHCKRRNRRSNMIDPFPSCPSICCGSLPRPLFGRSPAAALLQENLRVLWLGRDLRRVREEMKSA